MTDPLQDGIYIGLPDQLYFGQERLGSTDLVLLHKDPASWWYSSRHNPYYEGRETSDEMDFGSALHVLTLEGHDAFAERVVVSPFEDYRTKEARVWRDEQRVGRKVVLTEDAARRVRHMAALILNHPELGPPMASGLSEVSVLWTGADGVKLRARFDKLLPRFVVDLKSFGGDARGRSVRQQCLGLIAQRDMDVQRYLYFQARQKMAELLKAGALFGAKAEEADWLAKVAAIEEWEWCWVFYRRRDDAKPYAPVVKPILRKHLDATFESGRQKVAVALKNHAAFMTKFGPDVPWAVIEPADEPADHEFPPWLMEVNQPAIFAEEADA